MTHRQVQIGVLCIRFGARLLGLGFKGQTWKPTILAESTDIKRNTTTLGSPLKQQTHTHAYIYIYIICIVYLYIAYIYIYIYMYIYLYVYTIYYTNSGSAAWSLRCSRTPRRPKPAIVLTASTPCGRNRVLSVAFGGTWGFGCGSNIG